MTHAVSRRRATASPPGRAPRPRYEAVAASFAGGMLARARRAGQVQYRPVEQAAFTTVYAALRPSKWNVSEQEMPIARFIFIIN